MGIVAVTFRIMPEGPTIDLNKIKKDVEKAIINHNDIVLKNATIKPIGFGLSALEILLVMSDTGGTDKIEQEILKISGVESIESGDVTLL